MTNETKVCPYCAETIKAAAIVCRYCGRDLLVEAKLSDTITAPVEFKPHPLTMTKDMVRKAQMKLIVYPDRVVWKEGFLKKSEMTVFLNQITDIKVIQVPAGKLAKYGDVVIQTAGSAQAEIVAEGMKNPHAIRDLIFNLKKKSKE